MIPSAANPVQNPKEPRFCAARLRRILVVINPTAVAHPALDKAMHIATRCRSSIELYICDAEQALLEGWIDGVRVEQHRKVMRTRIENELNRLAAPLKDQGLSVSTVYGLRTPLEEDISQHVVRTNPDLVIKETHRHAPVRGATSRTDWTLIQQVSSPLFLVRAQPWGPSPRIAVALDPLHPSDRPTALGKKLAEAGRGFADILDGELDIFHVLQPPPYLPGELSTPEQNAAAHTTAREALQKIAASARGRMCFTEGAISEGLIGLVSDHEPDVLIMGVVPRPRYLLAPIGGTAARVVEGVDCDLLVIKPPGFVSPLPRNPEERDYEKKN